MGEAVVLVEMMTRWGNKSGRERVWPAGLVVAARAAGAPRAPERYPAHPETLRAKGSILLLMGEREKAIETYEAAEEIESDPAVRKKLDELQREPR